MGICGSSLTEDQKKAIAESAKLDKALTGKSQEEQKVIKVLLLGTGESGKSTIFKQMQILYAKGFSEFERSTFRHVVRRNVVEAMQALISGVEKFRFQWQNPHSARAATFFMDLDPLAADFWVPDIVRCGNLLWQSEPAVASAFENRSKLQILDSAAYLFSNLERIGAADYTPTPDDILRARLRTSGIVERLFRINQVDFKFLDVGGQRNERRKWIHCFEGVTAVIFVAAISEYDQVLYEDEKENRLHESIRVFDNICNNKYFEETAMIIFLNKEDIFREKIKRVPLHFCFEDYRGDNSYDSTSAYIKDRFIEVNKGQKMLFPHFTTATDTRNIGRVFEACKVVILKGNLEKLGLY
jgi:GTPase SAR1 family protein